ncbi:acyl-CoA synthetase FdrA [Buttiauxella noackiae]|uniref:acyl-CoA synthetase FdrA n=1 Tax=Buttiauxella noackiae TaxID=82992 RepID=UPI0023528E07|nr:acyl-CoA synthetase FdrA [Buttiauxella noackiae]MCA1924073.1 acyl-CoA synthetase FdrA [Buttiauxella noackiae]
MKVDYKVFKNLYQDSVSLMQISAQISKLPGIQQASVVMGTATNLEQLHDVGLGDNISAGPNDLIIAVMGEEDACQEALELAHERLNSKPAQDSNDGVRAPDLVSMEMAVEKEPEANLALISVPGDYAAAEAIKALNLGMNVMMFSDNVSIAQEKAIKTLARERNRIVMGPDCGTAIVNGIPLGFANVVKRGAIGVVGASGTGVQEVTCRIDQLGAGISQALGTGGHDLSEEIGGISMLFGLQALAEDDATKVIVLISKPPAKAVAERILELAQAAGKPVVVNFLGAKPEDITRPGVTAATTLASAADLAVALLNKTELHQHASQPDAAQLAILQQASATLPAARRFIRGVFAGGTFCYEAQLLCQQQGFSASSNTPVSGNSKLADIWKSSEHTLIDMGDDDFTRGKPHPMIDPTLRNQRIQAELNDPATAVVLFDLVLGYGASEDPATGLLELLAQNHQQPMPLLIAHVCGTEADPQVRSRQIESLRNAGVIVADCNAQAATWASIAAQIQVKKNGVSA